ncbi:MAG: zinc-ribbon domain-containing protein [Myxococcota bacterium]
MKCGHCGADLPEYARFCGACGAPQQEGVIRGRVPEARAAAARASALSDETLAGVGIPSARSAWTRLGIVAIVLVVVGAAAVMLIRRPHGPSEEHAEVVIAEASLEPSEPTTALDFPDELPEGEALEALVAAAVPGPSEPFEPESAVAVEHADAPDGPGDAAPLAEAETGTEAEASPMRARPTPMRVRPTTPMRAEARPAPSPPASEMVETASGSALNAATYGPAARRHIGTRYGGAIQRCFDEGDARLPGFSGTVQMAYALHPDGRVASARVAHDSTGVDVGACLQRAGTGWQLPAPPRRTLEFRMSFSR